MSAPTVGQWVVVSHGPGELAVLAQVIPTPPLYGTGVYLDRSPFRVLPANCAVALDDRDAAQAYCDGVNAANARYVASMERSRRTHNEEWARTVARL